MSTPAALLDDLAQAGVSVRDVWDLVNAKVEYAASIPVLLDWLAHLDERVSSEDREEVREGLVRALTIPAARPVAAPVLIEQFRLVSDPSGLGVRWVIGNALEVVADDSVFDEMVAIVCDASFGKARQMAVLAHGIRARSLS